MNRFKDYAPVALFLVFTSWARPTALGAEEVVIPWEKSAFSADEGCQWILDRFGLEKVHHNAHYLAPPRPGDDWQKWLDQLNAYRSAVRSGLHDASAAAIDLRFDGVRAWVRCARPWAFAVDLAPGEKIIVRGEARWQKGNNRLCLAFDLCARSGGADGPWGNWSTVLASATLPRDGRWHPFQVVVSTPSFDTGKLWARPILGMDGTFDKTPGQVSLRRLELVAGQEEPRRQRLAGLKKHRPRTPGFDDSLYRRPDQAWLTSNFVCGFLFIYDRSFWDPDRHEYRIGPWCEEAVREFGGYDSVVIWHAYPRIGADQRNQFDFFRDLPGGLAGLREVVRQFHGRGVKVFLPYNPWDTGTAREKESDVKALARLIQATEADGLFLDTMSESSMGLRGAIDAVRPGVAFEPEVHPSIEEMEQCNASWAQWLQEYPQIGVLHLKWIEQRHMQHQIRRWNKSHQDELAAAWFNGSGVLVWENIFGYWNPWPAQDRAALRRMTPILRHFADHLAHGRWRPYYPTATPGAFSSSWELNGTSVWTIVRIQGNDKKPVVLEVNDPGREYLDLWNGSIHAPRRNGNQVYLELPMGRYGAVAAIPQGGMNAGLKGLLSRQRAEALRPIPLPSDDPWVRARSVVEPIGAPWRGTARGVATAEMLPVKAGTWQFHLNHMRRECGCYPDPGVPPSQWDRFLIGAPHERTLTHRFQGTLANFRIDAKPVTNAQFEGFLRASGYRPRIGDNLLKHWNGPACPSKFRNQPVVYVTLDDARAYASWAKKRLPSEWEWHRAAQQHGDVFQRGEVWEWTESQRDDGHTRFAMLRGGCRWKAEGSIWYFPTGPQPIDTHAKFLLLAPGLDRCGTIGFRCAD